MSWPVPTARFALLVAVSGIGLLLWPGRTWWGLAVVEVVLVAAFLADALTARSPRNIRVQRQLPSALRVGDTGTLTWTVENRTKMPVRLTVTDALWPSLQASRRRVQMQLGPWGRTRATAVLHPSRRGRFPLDDITVRVRSPLGLAVRHGTQVVDDVVRVYPAFPSRDAVQVRLRQVRTADSAQQLLRMRGGGTEFHQLRDYTLDDQFTRIDWAATARAQRPIVRDYRLERDQTVVMLLDNGRVMAGSVGDVPRVEHAMDAALGLTAVATEIADRVGLVCFDSQVRSIVVPSASRVQRSRVAEAMYLLEPQLAESAYGAAFAYASARLRRRSLYVVFTDLAEAVVADALLPALATLTRTHLVVVAAVEDPVVAAWSRDLQPADGVAGIYRAAAAVGALESRRRAAAKLRAAGALVVDSVPGRLATDVVDAYLSLKAAGRL